MPTTEDSNWSGNALITGLKSKAIFRLEIKKNQVIHQEKFYIGNRIRALTIGHDFTLWALEDGGAGRLLKLIVE